MKGKFSLKTKDGSSRLFVLFLALVLLFSFVARMVSSDAGQVKISRMTIDARGAALDCELFYPAGTSDEDKLPAIILTHGGGVTTGNVKGFAEELSKRGFVVLSVNTYGVGLSEQPLYDEGDQGILEMDYKKSPGGMIDALDFLRTFKFIDQTRIGITGHSAGSRRSGMACIMDCGYLTLNDQLINAMYEDLGITFTEDEITMNADELSQAKLSGDQLVTYNLLKEEITEHYNTRIKAACLIGSNANKITPLKEVEVGGFTVKRNCQVNFGIVDGQFDYSYRDYVKTDSTLESWYTNGENLQPEKWYVLDDIAQTSTILGNESEIDVASNQDLSNAIENRTSRIICFNKESHSKNFWSRAAAGDVVKYFEQTLKYNCGNLDDASTVRRDPYKTSFMVREWCNCFAMISMVAMVIAFVSMLLKTEYFAPCVAEAKELPNLSKKQRVLINVGAIIFGVIAIYLANLINGPVMSAMPQGRLLPYFPSWWITALYVLALGAGSLILMIIIGLVTKKDGFSLKGLNIKLNGKTILKTLLLGTIMLAVGYFSLVVIEYLFGQDYRLWMSSLGEMKVELWRYIWRIALVVFPGFLCIGAAENYTTRLDIPEWKDTLITVIINSAGLYLLCAFNYGSLLFADTLFSTFISTYAFLILVPITAYITRKMYKLTNSIWLGAVFNSLLISWSLNTAIGISCEKFFGQTWISNFFNI